MIWQDIIITIVNIVISYALIPQIIYGLRTKKALVSLQTSIITSLALFTQSFAFFTLKLYISTTVCFLCGCLWAVLLFQRIKYKKVISST